MQFGFPSPLILRDRKPKQEVLDRINAYKALFRTPAGAQVLFDLSEFCHAYLPTYDADQRKSDHYEGRREVWLRIVQQMQLTEDELLVMAGGKYPASLPEG